MSTDDDLHRTFAEDAARTADADDVWAGVQHRVQRRRQRRERTGAVVVLTAVAGFAVALGAYLGAPPEDAPLAERTTATPAPERTSDPAPPALEASVTPTPAEARQAFADAGYAEEDARRLQDLWQWGDLDDVVVVAGGDLLAGEPLPLARGEHPAEEDEGGRAGLYAELSAFGEAGYTQADATALADEWGEDPQTVRVLVGSLLLEDRLAAQDAG